MADLDDILNTLIAEGSPIRDKTGASTFNFGDLVNPNALVVHHTGGSGQTRPTVGGVIQTFKDRNYPAHFIIDRDGSIIRTLPETARGQHTRPSEDPKFDISNANSWGVEIIALNDDDVLPAQQQAAIDLARYLNTTYGMPFDRVVGHGAINSHKQATEGARTVSAWQNYVDGLGPEGQSAVRAVNAATNVSPLAMAYASPSSGSAKTRDVPLPRPRPASPTDQIAAMFAGSFDNSGQRQDTAAGLDRFVAQQQAPQNPMVFGDGMSQTFSEAASKQRPETAAGLDAFLQQSLAPRQQTYAAQDAAPPPNLFGMNGDDGAPASGTTIATVPTVSSGVGQAPATRTVQSVSVKPPAATTRRSVPLATGVAPSYASMDGAAPRTSDPVGRMPAFGDIAMMFGSTPYATGAVDNRKDESRLEPATAVIDRNDPDWAASMGLTSQRVPIEGQDGLTVPLPRKRPTHTPQNTRVAVTHQQVANPEYQRLLQQISRGEAQMRGVSASGRPMSRDAYAATQSSQASIEALRRALASTPRTIQQTTRQPLKVTVNGAGSYGGGSVSAPPPETFKGTSSGRTYTEGQRYTMGGDTYTANANGSFTNDRTGRTQGTGTKYYDPDSNTFKTR